MSPPFEPFGPRGLRVLALLAAGLILSGGFQDHNRSFGQPFPLWERGLAAAVFLWYALATLWIPVVKRHAGVLLRVLGGALGWWVASGVIRNGLAVNDALALVVTAFAIGVLYPTVLGLVTFYAGTLILVVAGFAWGPPSEVEGVAVYGTLLTGFLATTMVARARALALAEISDLLVLETRVHHGIVVLDRAGRVRRSNEGFLTRLVGATPVGRPFVEFLATPPTPADTVSLLSTALARGTAANFEYAHARPDGAPTWLNADVTPIKRDGLVKGFLCVLTDASRSRALMTQIVEAMSDALFIVGGTGRIEDVNPAACRLLEATKGELVGQAIEPMIVPDWRWGEGVVAEEASSPGTGANLVLLLLAGDLDAPLVDLDLALRSRMGEVIPVLTAASVLPAVAGQPRRTLIVARDARERRRLEESRNQLERRVQEAQKLEGLGVLAGGIAHDFNNLLVGILGNSSLALSRLPPGSALVAPLEAIDRSAHRAADLTRQMLAYAGKGSFLIEPIGIVELVEEMVDLIDASLSKRANLTLELAPDLPAIEGDATQLRQLLMNLLTNASDALEDQPGAIYVSAVATIVESDLPERLGSEVRGRRCVLLEVRDTGVGMPEDVRRRMFDPFFTTKARGRGLGLAATLGIVQAHHAAVHVESAPGAGTRIRVWFPAALDRAVPRRAPIAPVAAAVPASGLILVVDDEITVREFITAVLEGAGFQVLGAADGDEGVQIVSERAGELAAVVLDLTMPTMGGDEALRAMRAIRGDLPILLSSGYSEADARVRFGALGAGGFLQKPYRAGALVAAVAAVASRAGPDALSGRPSPR